MFCSIQTFNWLIGWGRPTPRGMVTALLNLPIQMLVSSRSSFTDTPRIMYEHVSGNPVTHLNWYRNHRCVELLLLHSTGQSSIPAGIQRQRKETPLLSESVCLATGRQWGLWTVHARILPHIYWFRIKKMGPRNLHFYKASSKIKTPNIEWGRMSWAMGNNLPLVLDSSPNLIFSLRFNPCVLLHTSLPLYLFSAFLVLCQYCYLGKSLPNYTKYGIFSYFFLWSFSF